MNSHELSNAIFFSYLEINLAVNVTHVKIKFKSIIPRNVWFSTNSKIALPNFIVGIWFILIFENFIHLVLTVLNSTRQILYIFLIAILKWYHRQTYKLVMVCLNLNWYNLNNIKKARVLKQTLVELQHLDKLNLTFYYLEPLFLMYLKCNFVKVHINISICSIFLKKASILPYACDLLFVDEYHVLVLAIYTPHYHQRAYPLCYHLS